MSWAKTQRSAVLENIYAEEGATNEFLVFYLTNFYFKIVLSDTHWFVDCFIFSAFLTTVSVFFFRYEGTGRSLSLKLIQQLRQQSSDSQQSTSAENRTVNTARLAAGEHLPLSAVSVFPSSVWPPVFPCPCTARSLHEVSLHESIRYAPADPVERWLNDLLCLDCLNIPRLISGCPLPQTCDLYPWCHLYVWCVDTF